MAHYRTHTGDETAAVIRGVFTPIVPGHPVIESWAAITSCGTDLPISTQRTGLLDITYSTAWNLGKTLALTYQFFAASLSRLRNRILA